MVTLVDRLRQGARRPCPRVKSSLRPSASSAWPWSAAGISTRRSPRRSSIGTEPRPTAGSHISPSRFPARTAAASGASQSATRNIASLFKKDFALFKQIGSRSDPRAKCFLRRVRREKFPVRSEVYFCVHGTQKYAQRSENARPKGQRPLGRSVFRRGTGTRRSAGHFRR